MRPGSLGDGARIAAPDHDAISNHHSSWDAAHLELGGDVPEASTLGRFRNQLVEHDLWERLLGEINRQLEAKKIILTEGRINIIDASPIEAAQSGSGKGKDGQPKRDPDGGGT